MNCSDIALWIPEYVDGDVPDDNKAEVRAHLAACAACRTAVEKYQALVGAMRALPGHEPGVDTVLRITDAIHAVAAPRRRTEFGPVLDTEELADYLHVNASVIQSYLTDLPCFELGGKILFRRQSVDAWLERRESEFGLGAAAGVANVTRVSQYEKTGGVPWQN